jgi:hypothetical protein
MKRSALAVLVVCGTVAAVAAYASSRGPAVAAPLVSKSPAKELGPLLAVVPGVRGPVLGRADKRAIWVARKSPKLRLFNSVRAWAYAPDGSAIALATQPSTREGASMLQFVDPRLVRRLALKRMPPGNVTALAWGDGRVNVVLTGSGQITVVSVDAETHGVSTGATLAGSVFGVKRVGGRIVLVTGPARGVGTASLAVVEPSGALRTVALSQIQAGSDMGDGGEAPDFGKMRQNIPALAVDPDSGRAFVIPASGSIAQVVLSTLAVSYHSLVQPVSLLGRLHDWVEPKAEAKGANGPIRTAGWLGGGVVAVTGADETATVDASNQPHITWSPAGLTLIDTNTWGTKLIDRGADSFAVSGDSLLVTGSTWSDSERTGMGLAAYGFDGSRKLSVLQGDSASVMLAFRGKAYLDLGRPNTATVVDLVSGRLLRDRRVPLAQLLIGDGSN